MDIHGGGGRTLDREGDFADEALARVASRAASQCLTDERAVLPVSGEARELVVLRAVTNAQPAEVRKIAWLCWVEGHDAKDVAAKTQTPLETVERILAQLLEIARTRLAASSEHDEWREANG